MAHFRKCSSKKRGQVLQELDFWLISICDAGNDRGWRHTRAIPDPNLNPNPKPRSLPEIYNLPQIERQNYESCLPLGLVPAFQHDHCHMVIQSLYIWQINLTQISLRDSSLFPQRTEFSWLCHSLKHTKNRYQIWNINLKFWCMWIYPF